MWSMDVQRDVHTWAHKAATVEDVCVGTRLPPQTERFFFPMAQSKHFLVHLFTFHAAFHQAYPQSNFCLNIRSKFALCIWMSDSKLASDVWTSDSKHAYDVWMSDSKFALCVCLTSSLAPKIRYFIRIRKI